MDRSSFLATLGETCVKTGWQLHAWCLMGNHFHLIAETPQPNLVLGMKWLLGTYTGRFNRRHRLSGHLFGGRYKSLIIDERGGGYLKTACDYVHLNPVRAGLVAADQTLASYAWSSYPLYLTPPKRPPFLRVDRLLGEHGIQEDSAEGRTHFQARMEERRREGETPETWAAFRRGWRLGRRGQKHELARERKETDEQLAERLVQEWLSSHGWTEAGLAASAKGDPRKAELAKLLRRHTPMSRSWMARRLRIGSTSYVSYLIGQPQTIVTAVP